VLAGDIQLVDGLKVLNPSHQVATLDKKGPLSMELTVNIVEGTSPRNETRRPRCPSHDSDRCASLRFVRSTTTVQNARVGQQTDYDKLILEVWTNGAVRPADAVAFAAKILKEATVDLDQFRRIRRDVLQPAGIRRRALNENLFRSVDELGTLCSFGELPPERQKTIKNV